MMTTETLDLFTTAVKEVAAGPRVSDFQGLTKALLQRLAEKGLTLEECSDRRMLNRSLSTLQARCREFSIRFPDYTPSHMRKHLYWVPSGDFLNLTGGEVASVAKALNIVEREQDGEPLCTIPTYLFEEVRGELLKHGYVAHKAKPPKRRKVKADA